MGISDKIETFIIELMKGEHNYAEFGRNELAEIFNCVPSQINYVISTRFSPEKGYAVESRRGGGGYVKIRRINLGGNEDVVAGIGNRCTQQNAYAVLDYLYENGAVESQTARGIKAAVSDKALASAKDKKDFVRADILKNVIVNL